MAKKRGKGKKKQFSGEIVSVGGLVVPIVELPKLKVKVIDTRTTKLSYTCSLKELLEKLR